jgi:pyridoxal phosphate enzyme (YggS family)
MLNIAQNLTSLKRQIFEYAKTNERNPDDIALVAVSKTKPISLIQEAFDAGQYIFGENRVQELTDKYHYLPHAEWHLIGSLQTNKVKYIVPFVAMIHSVDSWKLLSEIEKQAAKIGRIIPCLLQINISNEPQKGGTTPAEARQMIEQATKYPHIRFEGFMGIAEDTEDQVKIRSQFASLRHLQQSLSDMCNDHQVFLRHLSMGMSHDFPLAIAEGATLIRIGSAIFGNR